MARIFISHSSHNNDQAIRLRDWLSANGWTDIFLDTDPERGLAPGERWQEALKAAADRCEAVLFLISTAWLASRWCLAEFLLARQLGKRIFPLLIEDIPLDSLPVEMTSNHQAVDLVHDALGWERLKEGLRRAGLDPDSFQFPEGRRPYPGFEPLTEDDAAIFFGREAHIVRGLDRLRAMSVAGVERALVVLGASGAGKSSFLRAGLWPRLKRDDRNFLPLPVMRPERGAITGTFGLLAGLENALADPRVSRHPAVRALPRSRGGLGELIARDPSGLSRVFEAIRQASAAALLAASEKPPPTVVISVDQAEELFNEEARTEAEQLMDQLASVLVHDRRLLVILAIRSDSYPRLQAERRLEAIRKEPFDLSPIPAGSLRLLIEGPARVAQPPVKLDPLLVNALLEDASDADSLPLLAFTLGRLYKAYGAGGELTIAAYEALGQISGAVNAAVSEVIARGQEIRALPRNREQLEALLREAFIPHLAKVNRAGHFGRRVAALTEIPARAHPIIDLFVRQHLLVKDRRKVGDSESADVIEVTHEALLREWQALRSWLEADREFLSGKEQLAEDIAAWKAAAPGQKDDALLSGLKLTRARQWLHARAAQDLTESERAYIAASIERADRRLRHSRLAWISAGIILVLCLVAALWQWERAEQSAVQANERLKLARKTSSQLVSLITNDLRTAQGIQTETLQRLLDAAKNSFENLATALKDDATFEAERARMMSGFGEAYVKAGQLTKAEEAFSEALGIYRKLLEREPNNLS